MVMKERVFSHFLLTIIMANVFFISILRAEIGLSADLENSPSCSSLGVQRSTEKKVAPPFSLKGLDGKSVSLSEFRGKPVLLVFWTTWCPTCREDLDMMEKFSAGKRDQLTVLLLAIDGERQKKIERIVKEDHITLPVLLILKEKTMDDYGVRGWIPLTFLIDGEGFLMGKVVGERDWSSPQAWSCLKELFSLR
jgi:cytochrome c biogenesis protein CcmG/thiol:disulfide interchange protein DsbE